MRRFSIGFALATAILPIAFVRGYAQAPAKLTFDVAAIKENKSADPGGRLGGPPARWTATNVPVLQFILYSYDVQDFQVEGGPDWIKTDRYDINAKADVNLPPAALGAPDPRREMLRNLLIERFKLATHTESKDRPIYALVMAKADKTLGPKLHSSAFDCVALGAAIRRGQPPPSPPLTPTGDQDCGIATGAGKIAFGTVPMSVFAAQLSQFLKRPVVDRTGLSGNYTATVTYATDAGTPDADAASVFTALQEQLGLKLESTRGATDILVIDHIEKPTLN